MTASFIDRLGDLTISNGQTTSAWKSAAEYEDAIAIGIEAPGTLPEAITIEVNSERDGTGTSATYQNDSGADYAGPAAGKARVYPTLPSFKAFRLKAGGAVAADRIFKISKLWAV